MLKNYVTIALRNILREKTYALLNITGLTIGISCALLLLLYVNHELSYDKHHSKAEQLYRLNTLFPGSGGDGMATGSPPIVWALKEDIPEIDNVTRVVNPPQVDKNLLRYKDRMFYETKGLLVDSTFFDLFSYEFVEGNPVHALDRPNTVVLKKSIAEKLFQGDGAVGQLITIINGNQPNEYEVTAVIADRQQNSHIDANFFITMNSPGWGEYINNITTWAGQNFVFSYIRANDGVDPRALEKKINEVLQKRAGEQLKAAGMSKELRLSPVTDIHLYSGFDFDLSTNGSIQQVAVISLIGLFILVIACINFVNIATAKASKRAMEIGVRKTLGAERPALIIQFFMEVSIFVLIAALFGVLLADLLLPFFNFLTGKELYLGSLLDPYILAGVVSILLITVLISGSYPAFLLSSYQPARVLKQKNAAAAGTQWFRKGLVVFQFAISIILIGSVVIMQQQMHYMENFETGYSSGSKLVIPMRTPTAQTSYERMKQKIGAVSGVKRVTAANYLPGDMVLNDSRIYTEGKTISEGIITKRNYIDDDYLEALNLKVIAGHGFTKEVDEPENVTVLNKKAAVEYGYDPEDAVGREIYTDSFSGEQYAFKVIGVVDNFNQRSLRYEIEPLMFVHDGNNHYEYLVVEVDPEAFARVEAEAQQLWSSLVPDTPWEYTELDQYIRQHYEADQRALVLISVATAIAIAIACLGLIGLSLFTARQKQKEISIRKVFGASVKQLVDIQFRSFLSIVLLSLLIASPVIYFAMDRWLTQYVYRIQVGAGAFIIAGAVALFIGILTIAYQAVKAALVNPSVTLRSE